MKTYNLISILWLTVSLLLFMGVKVDGFRRSPNIRKNLFQQNELIS